ncbi:MAG: hypothetical protein GY757_54560 [bacterium]|nr:hypothetical protein [bacterium]
MTVQLVEVTVPAAMLSVPLVGVIAMEVIKEGQPAVSWGRFLLAMFRWVRINKQVTIPTVLPLKCIKPVQLVTFSLQIALLLVRKVGIVSKKCACYAWKYDCLG